MTQSGSWYNELANRRSKHGDHPKPHPGCHESRRLGKSAGYAGPRTRESFVRIAARLYIGTESSPLPADRIPAPVLRSGHSASHRTGAHSARGKSLDCDRVCGCNLITCWLTHATGARTNGLEIRWGCHVRRVLHHLLYRRVHTLLLWRGHSAHSCPRCRDSSNRATKTSH